MRSDKATQHSSIPNLIRKVQDWWDWTYGSKKKHEEGQDTGSGVYHPCLKVSHYVNARGVGITNTISRAKLAAIAAAIIHLNVSHYGNPKGVGITNTTSRAKLAAIAAAIIHGYSHVAADSLTSMHHIKKQLSHPNLHRHHIQGDVLQSIMDLNAFPKHSTSHHRPFISTKSNPTQVL